MVHPTSAELTALNMVAREIYDSVEADAFRITAALSHHKAFAATRHAASYMQRGLVLDAAKRSASAAGVWYQTEKGGAVSIITEHPHGRRRFRIKGLGLGPDGSFTSIVNSASTLLGDDGDTLWPTESWLFGYVSSPDYMIQQIIAAEIVDWAGQGPFRLQFGTVIDLVGAAPATPRGFVSSDEDLDLFSDEAGAWEDEV